MAYPPNHQEAALPRALLDWSQQNLAEYSKIGNATIRNFEGGKSAPQHATLDVLRRCIEAAGVIFINGSYSGSGGPRVRLSAPSGSSIDTDDSEVVQYRENLENDAPPGAGG
ncbi:MULTISPECIES: helix-turn-helix transcriptional regulator [unclassified Rhizobium]|uniref:helix-turn-helix domain-containing protein n=1 Tax=unclassified Rhizobium TaxID=2613769 RepID=UPI000EA8FC6B|nr:MULTISPECIES: helix-turn-helix transcriptional regulator [unclassified Rhizobium]AYG65779.1 XRE family transcriptional regulator [Rhizobium sp. CCGE531]AYG72260.1 XRE family transcriptional regulator [Rhizobium sp. CCGE532]